MKPRDWMVLLLGMGWEAACQTNDFPAFRVETARDYLQSVSQSLLVQAGTNAETYWLQARVQSELGRKDEAERLARLSLERDSNQAEIHQFLGNLYIRADRLEEAAASLRKAAQIDPAFAPVYSQLGMVLDRLGDRKGAREAYFEGVRQNPTNGTVRLVLGRLLLDEGKAEEAIVQLEEACQLEPESAGPWYVLSQARSKRGDDELAQNALRRFRELKEKEGAKIDEENAASDNAKNLRIAAGRFHIGAASVLGRERKEALAEGHLRQALKIAPEEPEAYQMLGDLCLKRGELVEARAMFERLTQLQPQQVRYGVNLGTLLLRLKDWPAAENELKRVLALKPEEPAALNNLARYYLGARQELPEALCLCQRLAAVNPTAASYDLLGWALYANGKTNEAVAACGTALEKEPNNAVYRDRYRRLRQAAGITNKTGDDK